MAAFVALAALASLALASNPKRGLIFIPPDESSYASDNSYWDRSGSAISWYYNYADQPSPVFDGVSQEDFAFVPMMWGVNAGNLQETTFRDNVRSLIKDDGRNITHVLGFNEPNARLEYGGSDISPADAAVAWVANFEPLHDLGVKLGLPACTGAPDGFVWLQDFLSNCSQVLTESSSSGGGDKEEKECHWDFLPVHWYDNLAGLQSHMAERRKEWPGAEIWITEYALAHQPLAPTQEFFNETLRLFDDTEWIGGYSYFGAFRSDVSNVGPNAAFLNRGGELTDIGSWYLGGKATGVAPDSGSFAARKGVDAWAVVAVGLAGVYGFL